MGRTGYRGGDMILLRAGQRFAGTICLGPESLLGTSAAQPLTISSFGRGRATIAAPPHTDGIAAIDVGGVRVHDLEVVGRRDVCNEDPSNGYRYGSAGIRLEARAPGAIRPGLTVDQVDLSRFCDGIVVAANHDRSRVSGVRITHVTTHDNSDAGIWTYDPAKARHLIGDVTVDHTRAYRNGIRGGIVLFGVDGGTVTNSVAYANAREAGGGVGIWAFDSRRIFFADNESYRNGSRTITDDGDGFDFDRGVSDSVMVRNESHDNGGVGFLVCSCNPDGQPYYRMRDILLRSNVSRDDGSSGQSSLYVYGGEPMIGIDIVANRFESGVGDGPLVDVTGCRGCSSSQAEGIGNARPYSSIAVRGNTFIARGGKPLLRLHLGRGTDLDFRGNTLRARP